MQRPWLRKGFLACDQAGRLRLGGARCQLGFVAVAMCGIAILFEPTAPSWLGSTLYAMTRTVRHRGPNGEGFTFFDARTQAARATISADSPRDIQGPREAPAGAYLGFGHRRLSILDISSAGHQPMSDPAGECWLTFNGEIYNYVELREELARAGHAFRSGTDSEVILAAWREWGEACLPRFNGMFAFAIFDRRTRLFFAARDRFGVKPLYFWRTPSGGLALASEIKQFTVHPEWLPRINGQRAYDFLNWGVSDHTSETMFAGVQQLRGGEFFLATLDHLPSAQPCRWYDLRPAPFEGDFAAASQRFRELFDDSVRLRLRADVRVGSCLSGGLDSSSIVCTVRAQLGPRSDGRQKTFSAYSDVPRFDERSFIQEVAQQTGADAHQVVPDPQGLLADLDRIAWHQDEPFGSTSIFAQWCVFRLAREQDVTVMLDGQGADEALGGYHGYFGPHLAGLLRRREWSGFWREARAVRALHGHGWSAQLKYLADELLAGGIADRLRRIAGHTVLAPSFLDLERLGASPRKPHAVVSDPREPVRALSLAQLTSLTLPMLLRFEDRDSMAHGIEARLPFLDYRLVEFCLGLRESFKLSDGWTKRVLREGMRDRLPQRVRERRDKLGFATAEEVWMKGEHRAAFQQRVDETIAAAGGILTPAAREKSARILTGAEPFSFLVWRIISFGAWLRRFNLEPTPGFAAR